MLSLTFKSLPTIAIDLKQFKKELRRARPIPTALATVQNQGNFLRFGDKRTACVSVASLGKLKLFSIYLHF